MLLVGKWYVPLGYIYMETFLTYNANFPLQVDSSFTQE